MAAKRGPKSPMSDQHKAALAQGRAEGRVVRDYLDALRANKPKRGRKRTAESIAKRLEAIDAELVDADALNELKLVQERRDLQAELDAKGADVDVSTLEQAFVDVAQGYGERQGISYAAWREVGVEAGVLTKAGISRKG
ncbi:hypothetical protein BH24ACT5_BH24ACT5_22820 [soil metagenome]